MKEGLVNLPEDIVILQEKQVSARKTVLRKLSLRRIPESEAEDINRYIALLKAWQENGENNRACHGSYYYGEHDQFDVSYRVVLKNSVRATQV